MSLNFFRLKSPDPLMGCRSMNYVFLSFKNGMGNPSPGDDKKIDFLRFHLLPFLSRLVLKDDPLYEAAKFFLYHVPLVEPVDIDNSVSPESAG